MGTPVKVPSLSNRTYYDDSEKQAKPVSISDVSVGTNHLITKTTTKINNTNSVDWWIWGHNAFNQFGNGKIINSAKPLLVHHNLLNQSEVSVMTTAADNKQEPQGYLASSLLFKNYNKSIGVSCGANQTAFYKVV